MQNYFYNARPQQAQETPVSKSANHADNEMLVREDIVGELQAINQYQSHINQTTNTAVKEMLTSIKMEEEVHVGELMGLLFYLSPEAKTQFEKGFAEFETSKNKNN